MRRVVLLFAVVALLAFRLGSPMLVHAIEYPSGWNLVSGPEGSTLKGASGVLYTLQPGDVDYQQIPADAPLKGGYGYWAYFPSGGELIRGAGTAAYAVTLTPGVWAMVGNPASWDMATLGGTDRALTYSATGGYATATTLGIGQGAWVQGSGVLTVQAPAMAPLGLRFLKPAPANDPDLLTTEGRSGYLFSVSGANLLTLRLSPQNELPQLVHVTTSDGTVAVTGLGYGYLEETGELLVHIPQGVPSGMYTVTLRLPDGRTAQTEFLHTASPPVPPALAFVGAAATNPFPLPNGPPGIRWFEFRLTGFSLQGIPHEQIDDQWSVTASDGTNVYAGWGRLPPERVFVAIRKDAPGGTYTVKLTLPDGRTVQTTFTV